MNRYLVFWCLFLNYYGVAYSADARRSAAYGASLEASLPLLRKYCPEKALVWVKKGLAYQTGKGRPQDSKKAQDCFNRALEYDADNVPALFNRYSFSMIKHDYQGVINYGLRLLPHAHYKSRLLVQLGCVFALSGEYEKADLLCQQISDDDSRLDVQYAGTLWYVRALIACKKGSFEHAIACLQRSITLRPRPKIWYQLGLLYTKEGSLKDPVQAISCFAQAYAMEPENEQIVYAIACIASKEDVFLVDDTSSLMDTAAADLII